MLASDKDLAKLSENAGVDLLSLKEKYTGLKAQAAPTAPAVSGELARAAQQANDSLSKYKICQACQGLGIQKVKYNHMTLEKSCEACDGESIGLLDALQKELDRSEPE